MTTRLSSTNQVAERVGLSPTTIRIYEKTGRFPEHDVKIDGRLFWFTATVDEWLADKNREEA